MTASRASRSDSRRKSYAFGTKKPVILVRTNFRTLTGNADDYNPMLTQAATARIDLPAASPPRSSRRSLARYPGWTLGGANSSVLPPTPLGEVHQAV